MLDHKTTEVTITLTESEQEQIQDVTGKLVGKLVIAANDDDSLVPTSSVVQIRP